MARKRGGMTKRAWLAGADLYAMLEFVGSRTSCRKQRLVSCAYSRLAWPLLCEVGQDATWIAERYADGEVSEDKARGVLKQVQARINQDGRASPYSPVAWALTWGDHGSSYPPWLGAVLAGQNLAEVTGTQSDVLVSVVHDIFGNPFRPVSFNPQWLTSTVVALARGIYEERASDRLPILADALQDAGCDHPDLLDHCRSTGPHVRGCWVVDLILGKS